MDFSKHVYTAIEQEGQSQFSLERTRGELLYAVHFHNIRGRCMVLGDFGSWVFSREWHPAQEGFIAPHYFAEKVEAHPRGQRVWEWNPEGVRRNVQEYEGLEIDERMELLSLSDDEEGFRRRCEEKLLGIEDLESYQIGVYLQVLLDALNEMTKRSYKEQP